MRHRLAREGSPSLRSPSAPGSASGAETLASSVDPAYVVLMIITLHGA